MSHTPYHGPLTSSAWNSMRLSGSLKPDPLPSLSPLVLCLILSFGHQARNLGGICASVPLPAVPTSLDVALPSWPLPSIFSASVQADATAGSPGWSSCLLTLALALASSQSILYHFMRAASNLLGQDLTLPASPAWPLSTAPSKMGTLLKWTVGE